MEIDYGLSLHYLFQEIFMYSHLSVKKYCILKGIQIFKEKYNKL